MIRPATVRAATVQLVGTDESQAWDLTDLLDAVREAAAQGAQLVVLPELSQRRTSARGRPSCTRAGPGQSTGRRSVRSRRCPEGSGSSSSCPSSSRTCPGRGTTPWWFSTTARLSRAWTVTASPTVARKVHLPAADDPVDGYDEADHFVPGDWIGVHDTGVGTLGVLVCYDRRFPEAWRTMRALGADVVAVCVAGPGGNPKGSSLPSCGPMPAKTVSTPSRRTRAGTTWSPATACRTWESPPSMRRTAECSRCGRAGLASSSLTSTSRGSPRCGAGSLSLRSGGSMSSGNPRPWR